MKKSIISLILLLIASAAVASDGVVCQLSTYQKAADGSRKLVWSDSVHFSEGTLTSGFITAFSTDIRFTEIDSLTARFEVQLITLDKRPHNYSRKFTVEYGLPAVMDDIIGKHDSRFQFVITPLRPEPYDSSFCQTDHRAKGAFKVTPSANLDIYYVPNSFGDFYWSVAKSILEEKYKQLNELYRFNLPGKYNIYLAPCALKSVIWDKRFGMSIDPTRNTSYSIYNWNLNTFDPFVVLHVAVMRNFGYAPIFLTEGLASYVSYSELDMKMIIEQGRAVGLAKLLDSYEYMQADPLVADKSAATFARYMIRQYSIDKFNELYDRADELNLEQSLEEVYGKNVQQLETEWRQYIDTVKIDKLKIVAEIDLADALFNFDRMLELAKVLPGIATGRPDSIGSEVLLKRAYFNVGDYYKALEAQQTLLELQNTAQDWMGMGLYHMMAGEYDKAQSDLLTAHSQDTSSSLIRFNLALNQLIRGDTASAIEMFKTLLGGGKDVTGQYESRIILGTLLKPRDDKNSQALSKTYFAEAIENYTRAVQAGQPAPIYHLWLGIAFLGNDDLDNAYDQLQTALFLEQRPFYLGMINLWLGKLADLMSDHKAARSYYGEVLAINSAAYHQEEARRYLDQPFAW